MEFRVSTNPHLFLGSACTTQRIEQHIRAAFKIDSITLAVTQDSLDYEQLDNQKVEIISDTLTGALLHMIHNK